MKRWKTLAIMAVFLTLVVSSVVPAMASQEKDESLHKIGPFADGIEDVDLKADSLNIRSDRDGNIKVTFGYTYIGKNPCDGCYIALYWNDETDYTSKHWIGPISPIPKKKTFTTSFMNVNLPDKQKHSNLRLKAVIDWDNRVAEMDEENNVILSNTLQNPKKGEVYDVGGSFSGEHLVYKNNTCRMSLSFYGISSEDDGHTVDIYINNVSCGDIVRVKVTDGTFYALDLRNTPHSAYSVEVNVAGVSESIFIGDNDTHEHIDFSSITLAEIHVQSNCTEEVKVSFGISSPYGSKNLDVTLKIHITVRNVIVKKTYTSLLDRTISHLCNMPMVTRLLEKLAYSFNMDKTSQAIQPIPVTSRSTISPNIIQPNPTTEPNTAPNVQPTPSTTPSTTNSLITKLFETISEQINSCNDNAGTTPSTTPSAQPTPSTTPNEAIQTELADTSNTANEKQDTSNY